MNDLSPRGQPGDAALGSMPHEDRRTSVSEKSLGKEFPRSANDALLGRAFDPHRYRTVFPDRWAAFLRAHWGRDPIAIAVFFDVTTRTAENWLAGSGRATGDKVALAALAEPESFAAHFNPKGRAA